MIKVSGGGLVSFELYRLLGLPGDADPDHVRRVYEQHMSAAVRANNHQRALTLSAAFDALPESQRAKVYRRLTSTGSATATRWSEPDRRPGQRSPRAKTTRRGSSRRRVGRWLVVALGVAGIVFLVARHQSDTGGRVAFPRGGQQAPQDVSVESSLVANDLDSRYARADVACPAGNYEPGSTITCQSGDGASWTVLISGPPDNFEVVNTTPSGYARSAAQDARSVVAAVAQCRGLAGGAVPPTIPPAVAHAALSCGQATLTVALQPGNVLDYRRVTQRAFRLTVTATNGEIVRYDSRTGRYSPGSG